MHLPVQFPKKKPWTFLFCVWLLLQLSENVSWTVFSHSSTPINNYHCLAARLIVCAIVVSALDKKKYAHLAPFMYAIAPARASTPVGGTSTAPLSVITLSKWYLQKMKNSQRTSIYHIVVFYFLKNLKYEHGGRQPVIFCASVSSARWRVTVRFLNWMKCNIQVFRKFLFGNLWSSSSFAPWPFARVSRRATSSVLPPPSSTGEGSPSGRQRSRSSSGLERKHKYALSWLFA